MDASLKAQVELLLGSTVRTTTPVSGGCINNAWLCELADSKPVFVKSNHECSPAMFPAEARGLRWLAEADCIRTPKVLAEDPELLALEWIEEGAPAADYDEQLGRGLARLHRAGADRFGLESTNFLATLEQDNESHETWAEFYVQQRLRPLLRRAIDHGLAPQSLSPRFESLFSKMATLVGESEPSARLHGDLWSGNVHTDVSGSPVLIDPAVYGGNREIDLAMLQLFGAPSRTFFAAYDEIWPLQPGHQERVALYQIYPLLAHVNLFGGSYLSSTERAVSTYL